MSTLRKATTAAAISIAGAGIAVGGFGLATADDSTSGQDSTTRTDPLSVDGSTGSAMASEGPGPGRGGPGELAAELAEALGLQESDVMAALQAVHEQLEPEASAGGETRTPPTQAEHEARQAEMASALADELGVSEQKVTDVLDSMDADHMAKARSVLAGRLDTAVADGTLTKADKQAVLKAFDVGVLGSERHGPEGAGDAIEGAIPGRRGAQGG